MPELWYVLTWLLGGFVNGVTSFGGNLVAVPVLTLMLTPKEAIILGIFCGALIGPTLMLLYFRHILWKECLTLFIAQIPGLLGGAWILARADGRLLLILAASVLLLFLAWQILAARLSKSTKSIAYGWIYPAGLIGGVMSGATSFGGPALALYSYLRRWPKEETIATLCACGTFSSAVLLPWIISNDMFQPALLPMAIWGGIAVVLGILLSVPAVRRMKTALFRKLVFGMLLLSALLMFWRAIA